MKTLACHIFVIFSVGFAASVFAAGNFALKGKLRAFTTETVQIEDYNKIYTIKKKPLGEDQNKLLAAAKIDTDVAIQVPFEAVEAVKRKK